MRFELLHDIFSIHSCEESVIGQYMDPVLLRSGQYLQSDLLQKLNPLSLFEEPILPVLVGGCVAGVGGVLWVWRPLKSLVLALVKNIVILLCFDVTDGGGALFVSSIVVAISV